jgi:hypothetical protein
LFLDEIAKIDQRSKVIDEMQLDGYQRALKAMIQQADIESYHRGQEDIGRGYSVHEAEEDACRDDAPSDLDHPPKEQLLGKARQERDKEKTKRAKGITAAAVPIRMSRRICSLRGNNEISHSRAKTSATMKTPPSTKRARTRSFVRRDIVRAVSSRNSRR